MDLYRVLRLSFYAMAASATLPLPLAEHNPAGVAWIVCAAVAACLSVDRGRVPPVRPAFVYALALALLVYHFWPLRDEDAWRQHGLLAVAHFLCLLPAFLFFLSYGSAVLFVTGAASLALVIICGILHPGPGLFFRMALFVGLGAWTLLLHSLWRAREDFSARGRQPVPGAPPLLSERALYQGLALTALLSVSGLALGFFLFFSAPRVNETVTGWLEYFVQRPEPLQTTAGNDNPTGPRPGPATTGFGPGGLSVNDLGPFYSNHSPALTVTFSPAPRKTLAPDGRILLRGEALSEYENGEWQVPTLPKDQSLRPPADRSAPGITPRGPEFRQELAPSETLHSQVCFAAGPVARLSFARPVADSEGVWHAGSSMSVPASGDGSYIREPYEVWSYPPPRAEDLPADAEAVHPDRRYLRDGLPPNVRQDALDMALRLTRNDLTPLKKLRRIIAKLRDSGGYSYTWRLDELKRTGEPLAAFLLSPDPLQRRGHCGYFASAFVLLCRLNNLPARLAQGFAAPLPADWRDEQAQRVVFRNSDAHAWGEVFFKGYGWVAFDPTPAAPPPPAVAAVPLPPTPSRGGEGAGGGPAAAPRKALLTRAWDAFVAYSGKDQRALYRKVGEPMRGAGNVLSGESGWVFALLAWAGAVVAVWWMMQAFLRRGGGPAPRWTAGTARARATVAFYNDLLQALSRRGFVRKPGQTPREFAAQVLRQGGGAFQAVLVVTEIFESVRYGGREISQEEFNRLQEALDNLRELTFAGTQ